MPTSAQARRACAQSFWCALKVPLDKSAAAKEDILMMRDIAVSNRRIFRKGCAFYNRY
jgi:hypothetical protein